MSSTIYSQEQKKLNMSYKLISSKEGLEYIEKNGMTFKDYSLKDSIPSHMGVVYNLRNGEVILLHPNPFGKPEYPGFIFTNIDEFNKCCEADFFPIAEKDMTWLEAHAKQMQAFSKNDSFFLEPLREHLKVEVPFKSGTECELVYNKLITYIKKKNNPYERKQELVNCYALAVSKFLIEEKGFKWNLGKNYEVFNPYYYPEISNSEKENVNVISKLYIAVGGRQKIKFRDFYWYVTGIPIHVEID